MEMKKIVLFGDSLAAGLYHGEIEHLLDHYLAESLAELGLPEMTIVNHGQRGESTIEGLARIEDVVAEDGDYIVVLFGDNDAIKGKTDPVGYTTNLEAIMQRFNREAVLLLTPTYVNTKIRTNADDRTLALYAENAETAAAAAGVAHINLFKEMLKFSYPDDLVQLYDGLHPSKFGYHYLANLIAHKIAEKEGKYE